MTESDFFQDLALMMTVAGAVSVIFSKLKWPKVLGYIFAGVAMSKHTWGGSWLVNPESIATIAELGVVFLMFGMGLSFSVRDMRKIKAVAIPCAVVDTLVMIWLGYMLGQWVFGWSPVQSIFLGVAICDSATTLLAKVIDEMGWQDRPFAKYVLGTSVCEDIICVGAMAVAIGFAGGDGVSAKAMLSSLGGLVVFLMAVLVFGLILFPRLLVSVNHQHDEEAFGLTLLGGCFLVAWIAYVYDFSLALGAFLVGFLASNSDVKSKVGPIIDPLKSMFSAMFFITIGLLVDPVACWEHMPAILAVSLLVMIGKLINNTTVSLLAGLDVKTSLQHGFSLAQIGEFAFMVALTYIGIVEDANTPMFQIAVGVSLITTMLNPMMIKLSDRVGNFADRHLPDRFRKWQADYVGWLEKLGGARNSAEFIFLKNALIHLAIYAVLIFAVYIICGSLMKYDYARFSIYFDRYKTMFFLLGANLFAVGMIPLIRSSSKIVGKSIGDLLIDGSKPKWMTPVREFISLVLNAAVALLFFLGCAALNFTYLPHANKWVVAGVMILIIVIGILGGRRFFFKTGSMAVKRLSEALSSEQRREKLSRVMSAQFPDGMYHYLRLDMGSPAIGGTVVTLDIRAKTGASIIAVKRAGLMIRNVGPSLEFQVGDELCAIGESAQIAALKDLLGIIS